jgi:hypothetical protein
MFVLCSPFSSPNSPLERTIFMPSISTFLRKSPVSALRAYFDTAAFDLPVTIDWEGEEADIVQPLLKAVNEMNEAEKAQFLLDAERVSALADEAGNTALQSVVKDQAIFASLEVGHGCAHWVFLNEPESFRKAEEVRYTDHRRHGRAWDGFVLAENCAVSTDPGAVETFTAAIRERFKTQNVQIDIFERQRLCHDDGFKKLIQVAIYREGRPGAALRFSDAGRLTRHVDKPVYEAALTYEPASGAIEVIADRKDNMVCKAPKCPIGSGTGCGYCKSAPTGWPALIADLDPTGTAGAIPASRASDHFGA